MIMSATSTYHRLTLFVLFSVLYFSYIVSTNYTVSQQQHQEQLVIVVPGGGLTAEGSLPTHTLLRLEKALVTCKPELEETKNCIIITLSYGTTHKPPPLDKNGFPLTEAMVASKHLIINGFPPENIYEENLSLDTIGNAYFLRTLHIVPMAYDLKNPRKLHLVVITNNWHMERTKAIFEKVFSLPLDLNSPPSAGSLASQHCADPRCLRFSFQSVEAGVSNDIYVARSSRERTSLQNFLRDSSLKFNTLTELQSWLFTQHNAYAAVRHKNVQADKLDPELMKSY